MHVLARVARLRVAVLRAVRRGAALATHRQALRARRDVTGSSTLCAGRYCLQRSLATALLCRMLGTWPTWCSGVRTPPFSAHARVEAEGRRVGEPADTASYRPLLPFLRRHANRPLETRHRGNGENGLGPQRGFGPQRGARHQPIAGAPPQKRVAPPSARPSGTLCLVTCRAPKSSSGWWR
ncbi:lasso peptide biosynthesis B2 protein [Streptomyces glaucescens]|uniref:lasso peptide biosynthesis B2 protein n=1 Tax=Streptomyces glaucescens TaxID=1907 RepID=UPI00344D097A